MWCRWERYAFLARYGNQDITSLLGRKLSLLELSLLGRALLRLVEIERQSPDGL